MAKYIIINQIILGVLKKYLRVLTTPKPQTSLLCCNNQTELSLFTVLLLALAERNKNYSRRISRIVTING